MDIIKILLKELFSIDKELNNIDINAKWYTDDYIDLDTFYIDEDSFCTIE